MFSLNCDHWSVKDAAPACAAGHFGGKPTPEQCMRECVARTIDGNLAPPDPDWKPIRPLRPKDFIAVTVKAPPVTTQRQARPIPTIAKIATAVKTMATRPRVSLEVLEQREAICAACDQSRVDSIGRWCQACGGCGVSRDMKGVPNLAAWEERRDKAGRVVSGCKHPKRDGVKFGWPIAQPTGA